MTTAVLQIIADALLALGIIESGGAPTPGDAQLGLRTLNRLIGQYSTDRLLIYSIARTLWTIIAGQATYTVGTGADIDIPRPSNMNGNGANVQYIDTSQGTPLTELGMTMLTDDSYQLIVQKTYQSAYPTSWYYNPTYSQASPYGSLTFWPVPNVAYLQGVLYVPTAVQAATITGVLALPPEWERFLVTNLAMELLMFYPSVRPSNELQLAAKESKGVVEATNTRLVDLSVDRALQPTSQNGFENFYTGSRTR